MPPTSAASKRSHEAAPRPSHARRPRAAGSAGDRRLERLLAVALAGTAARRERDAAEIERLAKVVDYDWLAAMMAAWRLLPLLGSRLVAAAPGSVPGSFRESLDGAIQHGQRRAALVEQVALRLVRDLEREGVPVVPLKGPHLAERLHGDAGLRASSDIDLLVKPEDFHEAVRRLGASGYRADDKAAWIDDLPLFEASVWPGDDWRPPIDLHWRLHWYEESFSRQFVRRSEPDARGARVARPLDELAALLLFWCRDGLAGLRHAADVGAWWDRYGSELEPGALDEIAAAHPPLRHVLAAAALHAEQAVGVPADRLFSGLDRTGRRMRLALRFANLVEPASKAQNEASVVLVDGLLAPRGGRAAFIGRHLALPAQVIDEVYGLPSDARVRRTLRRAYYALRVGARVARGAAEAVRARR